MVQHARKKWRGGHCVQSLIYLIFENHALFDAISFAYGDSIEVVSRAHAPSLKETADNEVWEVDVDGSENECSESRKEKNKSSEDDGEKYSDLSDCVLETGSIPEKK